jgi:hypothetical protein
MTEVRRQMSDVRRQKTDNRGKKPEAEVWFQVSGFRAKRQNRRIKPVLYFVNSGYSDKPIKLA